MKPRTIVNTGTALDFPGFPLSPAVIGGGLVHTAGVLPIDPVSGEVVGTTIDEQAPVALSNLSTILEAAHTTLERVLIVHVHLADIEADLTSFNVVYEQFFRDEHPARISTQAKLAWSSLRVELTAVALASP